MKVLLILLISSVSFAASNVEAIGKRFDAKLESIKKDCSGNWTNECKARLKLAVDQEDKEISDISEPYKTEAFQPVKNYPGAVTCVNARNQGIMLEDCW